MIWLQSAPWGRWLLSGLIACFALWIELRPEQMTKHPFALSRIEVGEPISAGNTTMERVPASLFIQIDPGSVATSAIPAGAPIHVTDTESAASSIPPSWWVVSAEVPANARSGDTVKVVLLDTGEVVSGVIVTTAIDDGFSTSGGGIAIEPTSAVGVAQAAAEGRIAVLISTG